MKKLCRFTMLCLAIAAFSGAEQPNRAAGEPRRRFHTHTLDVCIDTANRPLAAYQIELAADLPSVRIVGIEGGDSAAFANAPYYDPAALQAHRVILAAFHTTAKAPAGRIRVARLRLHVEGEAEPTFAVRLHLAASPDGRRIPATVSLERAGLH